MYLVYSKIIYLKFRSLIPKKSSNSVELLTPYNLDNLGINMLQVPITDHQQKCVHIAFPPFFDEIMHSLLDQAA